MESNKIIINGITPPQGTEVKVTVEDKNELYQVTENEVYQVTENDLIGDIEDFPIEVVQRMVDNQVEQGNKDDVIVFQNRKETNSGHGGFRWDETEEGLGFWDAVICEKNFNLFFQKYPKQNQLTIQKDNHGRS